MFDPQLLAANLLSPMVLAFGLGVAATWLRSDLEVPQALHQSLSIFLLLAIGLKGGVAVSRTGAGELLLPLLVTVAAGCATTATSYWVARHFVRLSRVDAAALAAHFGCVSAVTFIAARDFAARAAGEAEGMLVALLVALEVPAILLGLALGLRERGGRGSIGPALREVATGKTMLLLGGGLLIGWISGEERSARVAPLFVTLFDGVLMLFLLDLGMAAARRMGDVRKVGWRLVAFSMLVPVVHGVAGAWIGSLVGLSLAGAAVFGAMLASASYIAAPAAIRTGLPQANPSLYLTAALGIAFPFNLALGIPLYFAAARLFAPA